MKSTLLIPTLNEIDGMKAIVPRIKKEWVDEIIVVDGGSSDGTAEYSIKAGLKVIQPKPNGLVPQLNEAFKLAKGDIIILFSPDGNSIPEIIPNLIKKIEEGYDMVIVSRYMGGAKSYDDSVFTAIGNHFFTRTVNLLFRASYTDALVIFRAFKKDVIKKIGIDVKKDIDIQLSIRCAKKKLKVADIPGDEPKRLGGVKKMGAFKTGFTLIKDIITELFNT